MLYYNQYTYRFIQTSHKTDINDKNTRKHERCDLLTKNNAIVLMGFIMVPKGFFETLGSIQIYDETSLM